MLMKVVVEHIKPYWQLLVGVLILQIIGAIASLTLPNLQADVINDGLANGNTHYIWTRGGAMLCVSAVQVIVQIIAIYCGARAAMSMGRDIRGHLYDHVLSFSAREINHFGAPTLITRNTNDVLQVQNVVMFAAMLLVTAPVTAIGGVIMAIHEGPKLSWLIVVAVVALGIVIGVIISRLLPLFRQQQTRIDDINRVMREQLSGVRVIRAFVRESYEEQRFAIANGALRDVGIKIGITFSFAFPLVQLIAYASNVGVLWFGAGQVSNGDIAVGNITAFLQYLMQILMSVMMATMMTMFIPRAQVCAGRIQEVLGTESSVEAPTKTTDFPPDTYCQVEFRDVEFSYPQAEQPVLKDISFTMRPGTTTAIIGATGAGKTTLVNLIPRLYDTTKGQVLVDGVDVRQLDPEALWSKIGLVPQKGYLFTGTVASNLEYGKPDATTDDMWGALRIAQADDFVRQMEGQLDAEIAQGGTNVSGGQRQRLSIARALIKMPEIYIFDDAFSALDVATDAKLRSALATDTGSAAVLIVAQRVSSISHADQILVLDEGRIVGTGTHTELMQTCPTYREIVDSQVRAGDEMAVALGADPNAVADDGGDTVPNKTVLADETVTDETASDETVTDQTVAEAE
ncbi:MAG: ABC transporter ATP-binding protein/permease [Propionibacteriaceae bacterium]|nr:ABC transporter ATP-binding protein/permease [Propionibacteriaceae bacterium]